MAREEDKFQGVTDEQVIMPESGEAATPTAQSGANKKQPKSKKTWLPIVIGVVVLVGLGVGAYFLLKKPAPKPDETATEEVDEEENLTDEERLEKVEDEIANATEETYLPLVLEKAARQVSLEQYEEALVTLTAVSEAGLDDSQLYNLYSIYVMLYTQKGDETELEEYTAKQDTVYQRLEAAGAFGTPTEEETPESTESTEQAE